MAGSVINGNLTRYRCGKMAPFFKGKRNERTIESLVEMSIEKETFGERVEEWKYWDF